MCVDIADSIYEMLDSGITLEEIKEEIERIAIEQEQAKIQDIEDSRAALASAFCDYLEVLGIIDDSDGASWRETFNTVDKYFKEFEENILAFNSIMNKSKKKGGDSSADATTAKFDEELRRLVKILSNIEK